VEEAEQVLASENWNRKGNQFRNEKRPEGILQLRFLQMKIPSLKRALK